MTKKITKAAPVLVIVVLLVIWELAVQLAGIPLYVLPAPSDMLIRALVKDFPALMGHAGITVMEALAGMGISFVVGIITGIMIDAMPTLQTVYLSDTGGDSDSSHDCSGTYFHHLYGIWLCTQDPDGRADVLFPDCSQLQ